MGLCIIVFWCIVTSKRGSAGNSNSPLERRDDDDATQQPMLTQLMPFHGGTSLVVRLLSFVIVVVSFHPPSAYNNNHVVSIGAGRKQWVSSMSARSTTTTGTNTLIDINDEGQQQLVFDEYLPTSHPLHALLYATAEACIPLEVDGVNANGDGSFRYEWGTWCCRDKLETVRQMTQELRLYVGVYDTLIHGGVGNVHSSSSGDNSSNDAPVTITKNEEQTTATAGRRIRIASGKYWDVILNLLPKSSRVQYKWPEGSWTLLQPMTGVIEVSQLRGPDKDGYLVPMRPKDLRGGGDGSGMLGSGSSEEVVESDDVDDDDDNAANIQVDKRKYSTSAGDGSCIKYLGGPLRRYTGKAAAGSTMIEINIRPPIAVNVDAAERITDIEEMEWEYTKSVLVRVKTKEEVVIVEEDEELKNDKEEEQQKTVVVSSTTDAPSSPLTSTGLNKKLGMEFENVGGLDSQLDDIARRVLASRANPAAARRLGVSHVRGILLSGPPGCGKTLLARELSRILGAREPQIVNGPEILDKFIGEAERRVRELFLPAEREYEEVGDASALHLIILDEMDAIARKRGSMSSDTTGVRDSVVNQLLAKMDGVKAIPNVLIVGLTNRPELIDPALLRPGRLEVQLRVELPDRRGRRDILAIHTRSMREQNALSKDAIAILDDVGDDGMGARTEHFSGAELAGLVRSAASFALARAVENGLGANTDGMVTTADLERALVEVRPALGTQDEVLKRRYPFGISEYSSSMKRIKRDLTRFTTPVRSSTPRLYSLLLVGASDGAGVTALASNAAAESSFKGHFDFVRFITALDVLTDAGGDEARAAALSQRFSEAREMSHSLLVLDDIDQIVAGSGPNGYSSIMLSTLRALLRTPPSSGEVAKAGGQSKSSSTSGRTLHIIATSSRSDAACIVLNEIFEETIVVPLLSDVESVQKLLTDCLPSVDDASAIASSLVARLDKMGCKAALRLAERAVFNSGMQQNKIIDDMKSAQLVALESILDDLAGDDAAAARVCEII